jgi:hypothetical protein
MTRELNKVDRFYINSPKAKMDKCINIDTQVEPLVAPKTVDWDPGMQGVEHNPCFG